MVIQYNLQLYLTKAASTIAINTEQVRLEGI